MLGSGVWSLNDANVLRQAQTTVFNAQTGTTYTLLATDAGKLVTLDNASPITLTVPTNATAAFTIGQRVDIVQLGAGQVSVAPAAGVTLNSNGNDRKISDRYAAATICKIGTDSWLLIGSLDT
jgi:hypothetical protein